MVLDFDGVLTDNRVWVSENGSEMVAANRSDSLGIRYLRDKGVQVIVLSTAHPGKFTETVRTATGQEPELPERLARCLRLPKRATRIGPDLDGLRGLLLERFG